MNQDNPKPLIELLSDGTPVRSEEIGFRPDLLTTCCSCGRKNPPDRAKCLYCGEELSVTPEFADKVAPELRKLEDWESGYNIIISPADSGSAQCVPEIARMLEMEPADIGAALETGQPLPIARLVSLRDAERSAERITELGIPAKIVADADLMPDRSPTRLRSIEFGMDELILVDFNRSARTAIANSDLVLIVTGVINETKTDILEKKRRGSVKVLDESETFSDEAVIDIYSRTDPVGSRVLLTGFDFSCLGADRGLIAAENLRSLVIALHEFAPESRIVNSYSAVRDAIAGVWEIDHRRDSRGMQRSGFGKFEFGNTASSSNLKQFNIFSRLQWHLL